MGGCGGKNLTIGHGSLEGVKAVGSQVNKKLQANAVLGF
jgi:hypothetical protein